MVEVKHSRFYFYGSESGVVISQSVVVFVYSHLSTGRTLILLYVDDMLITGDDPDYITFVKEGLCEQFMMFDLGSLSYFLGIEIASTADGYYLS